MYCRVAQVLNFEILSLEKEGEARSNAQPQQRTPNSRSSAPTQRSLGISSKLEKSILKNVLDTVKHWLFSMERSKDKEKTMLSRIEI